MRKNSPVQTIGNDVLVQNVSTLTTNTFVFTSQSTRGMSSVLNSSTNVGTPRFASSSSCSQTTGSHFSWECACEKSAHDSGCARSHLFIATFHITNESTSNHRCTARPPRNTLAGRCQRSWGSRPRTCPDSTLARAPARTACLPAVVKGGQLYTDT